MSFLFYGCSSLSSLPDISKWNTLNVTKINSIFDNCSSLKQRPALFNFDDMSFQEKNKEYEKGILFDSTIENSLIYDDLLNSTLIYKVKRENNIISKLKEIIKNFMCSIKIILLPFILFGLIVLLFGIFYLLLSIISPFWLVYISFYSNRDNLLNENSSYNNYFTSLNNGIEYKTYKILLIIENILSSIIYIIKIISLFFIHIKGLRKYIHKSYLFFAFILILNIVSIIIYIFNIIEYARLSNSFKDFAKNIDEYFQTNNTYIIPYGKRENYGNYGNEIASVIIHLIFSFIYNFSIVAIYKTIKKYKNGDNK